MSTIVNVVQSNREHKDRQKRASDRDIEGGLKEMQAIRRKRLAEDTCKDQCKAGLCMAAATTGLLYAMTLVIILITESYHTFPDPPGLHQSSDSS